MLTCTGACSAPSFEPLVEKNVMMPLRDGVRLAMDIYFPATDGAKVAGTFPVVFGRTPYDKNNMAERAAYYAARGYVAVMQDVRGRYASEGTFYPFAHEAPDGYDAVEWLAAQPWCNGRIGTLGQSYMAAVQNALACLRPPHLSAMVVTFGPSSYFHSAMRHNGVLELRFMVYAFLMAATSREAAADPVLKAALEEAYANVWQWIDAGPIRPGATPLRLVPSYEQWAVDVLTRATYDDYWRQPGYGPMPYYDQHADVPTLYIGGWYDTYTRSTAENFVALSKRQQSAVHMLLGPWTHGCAGGSTAGDASFAPDGGLADDESVSLRWFDQWLRDMPVGVDREARVDYFVMGGGPGPVGEGREIVHGGQWKSADTWPPPDTTPTPFYLHADASLTTAPPTDQDEPSVYTFDPANPVPTVGGHLSAIPVPAGAFDQRNDDRFYGCRGALPLSARRDVLCFVTGLLDRPVEIAGPITVTVWVSTDAPDTDFAAKLIDVYPPSAACPNGCALNLTDSIARLRFRNGYERQELAEPGEAYELRFEMYPTANRFAAGHAIRVDISSSSWPRFELNPNTGAPLGTERRLRKADNAVYHSAARPSHIVLSVVR